MDEIDWQRLVSQLARGDCTPFVGAGACQGTLPTGAELSREIATRFDYPFADADDLARVAQYAAIALGDTVSLKEWVCEHLRSYGRPSFGAAAEPHSVLARLPLPVYLTTNYDDFMASALRLENKEPRTEICQWADPVRPNRRRGAGPEPEPTQDRPLVYHLHGSCHQPSSLVLTEDDYLEFLAVMATDRAAYQRMLPDPLALAITQKPLLFVGYRLHDWTFRTLFHGLFKATARVQWRRHISIQLTPSPRATDPATKRRAEEYLDRYFAQWNIAVFWGTAEMFFGELADRLGGLT